MANCFPHLCSWLTFATLLFYPSEKIVHETFSFLYIVCVCRICVGVVVLVGVVWVYLNEAGEKMLDKMTLRFQQHESPTVSTGDLAS